MSSVGATASLPPALTGHPVVLDKAVAAVEVPQLPHKDKRYVVEVALTIFLFALSFSLHLFLVPKPLPFFVGDLSIAYPLYTETVPIMKLFAISFTVPAVAILFGHSLQHLRSPTAGFKNLFVSYLWCLLGVFQAMGILFTVVNFLKLLTGRQRPNFLSLCDWKGYRAAINAGGKVLQSWYDDNVAFGQLGDISDCKGTVTNVADSLRSFPSGHSAISWSSMTYTALYLRSVFGVPRGVSISIPALASALPFAISSWIAVSRVIDRWHNTDDVAIGSTVGIISGFLGWAHYLSLRRSGHAPTHGAARLEVEARARDRMRAFAGKMWHRAARRTLSGKRKGEKEKEVPLLPTAAATKKPPSPITELEAAPSPSVPEVAVPPAVAVTPTRARAASRLPLMIERLFFRPRHSITPTPGAEPMTPASADTAAASQDPLAITPEEESDDRALQEALLTGAPLGDGVEGGVGLPLRFLSALEGSDGDLSSLLPPSTPILSSLEGNGDNPNLNSMAAATYGNASSSAGAVRGLQPVSLQESEETNDHGLAGGRISAQTFPSASDQAVTSATERDQLLPTLQPAAVPAAAATRHPFAPVVSSPLSKGSRQPRQPIPQQPQQTE